MISVLDEFAASGLDAIETEWRPRVVIQDKRTPSQWAVDERWIGKGASPLSEHGDIKYNFDICPWVKEPTDTPVDRDVQVMVLMWAGAMMKTDGVGSNIIGWSMTESPTNIQVIWPTDKRRDEYSRDIIDAGLINATPCLRKLIPLRKSRDAGNTIRYKKFPGGSLYLISAGSASNFRGPRIGCSWNAEADDRRGNIGNEGDPIFLSLKRCEGFPNAIKVIEGTPTIKGHSRTEWWYDQSDRRRWFCPCRSCDALQVLCWTKKDPAKFSNLVTGKPIPHATVEWPKQGKNRYEKAVVLCGQCAASHNDRQRIQMVLDGQWQATAHFNGIRGYWLNGVGSTLPPEKGFKNKLHQFAIDAHRAKHSQNPRETVKVWVNTFLAETFQEEQDVKASWTGLFTRREEYPIQKVTV